MILAIVGFSHWHSSSWTRKGGAWMNLLPGMNLPKVLMEGLTPSRPTWQMTWRYMRYNMFNMFDYMWVKSRVFLGNGHPRFNRESYWVCKRNYWVYKLYQYCWVDDHPLLYGNTGSLDLSTHIKFNTFLFCAFAIFQTIHHAYSTEVLRCSEVGMFRDAYLEVTAASTWRLLRSEWQVPSGCL